MSERSLGMATGTGAGFGDGNVGAGYSTSRMITMETKTLGEGVLHDGNIFTMSGIGTGTLTIADGSAIAAGFFYENTGSAAIVVSTLANATYNVVIMVNDTAGSFTVSRSVAGTTVGAYTVRLAVATNAQIAAPAHVKLGTITVSGAVITAIAPDYDNMYATSMQLPYQSYATMDGGTATLTLANTGYDVAGYSSSSVTDDNVFSLNTTTGVITVRRAGLYLVHAYGSFASGTTGNRLIGLAVNGTITQFTRAIAVGITNHAFSASFAVVTTAVTDNVRIQAVSSLAAQSYSVGLFTISRA